MDRPFYLKKYWPKPSLRISTILGWVKGKNNHNLPTAANTFKFQIQKLFCKWTFEQMWEWLQLQERGNFFHTEDDKIIIKYSELSFSTWGPTLKICFLSPMMEPWNMVITMFRCIIWHACVMGKHRDFLEGDCLLY